MRRAAGAAGAASDAAAATPPPLGGRSPERLTLLSVVSLAVAVLLFHDSRAAAPAPMALAAAAPSPLPLPAASAAASAPEPLEPDYDLYNAAIDENSVDGVFLFTIVRVGVLAYARAVSNWARAVEGSFEGALGRRRLIIAPDTQTCDLLLQANVTGCLIDIVTANEFAPAAAPKGLPTAKFVWTLRALQRGKRVIYADVDAVFRRRGSPLAYLVDARQASGGGVVPGLQMMSDMHSGPEHACTAPFGQVLEQLGASSRGPWTEHTYGSLFAHLPADACSTLTDELYSPGSTCVSTGFWLALPTPEVLELFEDVINLLRGSEYLLWDQAAFNAVLPRHLERLAMVLLDPAVFGSHYEQACALAQRNATLAAAAEEGDAPLQPPLLTHYAFVHGYAAKLEKMRLDGAWVDGG